MTCSHPCHFECVHCERIVCTTCKAELAGPTNCLKTLGYTCRLDGRECRENASPPSEATGISILPGMQTRDVG